MSCVHQWLRHPQQRPQPLCLCCIRLLGSGTVVRMPAVLSSVAKPALCWGVDHSNFGACGKVRQCCVACTQAVCCSALVENFLHGVLSYGTFCCSQRGLTPSHSAYLKMLVVQRLALHTPVRVASPHCHKQSRHSTVVGGASTTECSGREYGGSAHLKPAFLPALLEGPQSRQSVYHTLLYKVPFRTSYKVLSHASPNPTVASMFWEYCMRVCCMNPLTCHCTGDEICCTAHAICAEGANRKHCVCTYWGTAVQLC